MCVCVCVCGVSFSVCVRVFVCVEGSTCIFVSCFQVHVRGCIAPARAGEARTRGAEEGVFFFAMGVWCERRKRMRCAWAVRLSPW